MIITQYIKQLSIYKPEASKVYFSSIHNPMTLLLLLEVLCIGNLNGELQYVFIISQHSCTLCTLLQEHFLYHLCKSGISVSAFSCLCLCCSGIRTSREPWLLRMILEAKGWRAAAAQIPRTRSRLSLLVLQLRIKHLHISRN